MTSRNYARIFPLAFGPALADAGAMAFVQQSHHFKFPRSWGDGPEVGGPQLSSEKDKERVYKLIGQYSRPDANGVPQVCFIGVTNPQIRASRRRKKFAMIFCSPQSTSQKSGSAQLTTAASRPSAST